MNNQSNKKTKNSIFSNITRRDMLKGLLTLPVFGIFGYGLIKKLKYDYYLNGELVKELGLKYQPPELNKRKRNTPSSNSGTLKIGIIGFGKRGEELMHSLGYTHPQIIENWLQSALTNRNDSRLEEYLTRENLNVEITAICDIFDIRADKALAASTNNKKTGIDGPFKQPAKRYLHYQDLLKAKDVDAVVIATPDHWHAQMCIDAVKAGKHVYLERSFSRNIEEAYRLRNILEETNIIFQHGHQTRQYESQHLAKDAIEKKVLGKINLVEICTNLNTPEDAWVTEIHPEASYETIDWSQFVTPTSQRPFSLERFFRWRCWWDYGNGMASDQFAKEYDAINQILNLGIPHSVVASGGIYFYKDGRNVPDVYHSTCEYPHKNITLQYSGTLSNSRYRGKLIMGHDASMELSDKLNIYPDSESTRYKEKIDQNLIDLSMPLYSFTPGGNEFKLSPKENQDIVKDPVYAFKGKQNLNPTFLHLKEWLDAIRSNGNTSCNAQCGFEEAVTTQMGTISLREGRKVYWDQEKQNISKG